MKLGIGTAQFGLNYGVSNMDEVIQVVKNNMGIISLRVSFK